MCFIHANIPGACIRSVQFALTEAGHFASSLLSKNIPTSLELTSQKPPMFVIGGSF